MTEPTLTELTGIGLELAEVETVIAAWRRRRKGVGVLVLELRAAAERRRDAEQARERREQQAAAAATDRAAQRETAAIDQAAADADDARRREVLAAMPADDLERVVQLVLGAEAPTSMTRTERRMIGGCRDPLADRTLRRHVWAALQRREEVPR